MADTESLPPGTFTWMELGTRDTDQAKGFYGEVIGWTYRTDDLPGGETYTIASAGDKTACGMYTMPKEMEQQGIPPFWLSYVGVQDVDAAAARVTELGGQVMKAPFDVLEYGRMAVCMDPAGAAFAMWQAGCHAGATPGEGAAGTRCWTELASTDIGKSGAFYSALFGWSVAQMEMNGTKYTMFKVDDQMVAGMMDASAPLGSMPSTWISYVIVEDHDGSLSRAEALGGKALTPAMEMPNIGRYSILQDQEGAVFGIMQPSK